MKGRLEGLHACAPPSSRVTAVGGRKVTSMCGLARFQSWHSNRPGPKTLVWCSMCRPRVMHALRPGGPNSQPRYALKSGDHAVAVDIKAQVGAVVGISQGAHTGAPRLADVVQLHQAARTHAVLRQQVQPAQHVVQPQGSLRKDRGLGADASMCSRYTRVNTEVAERRC
jgi:hypothetical protein